MFIHNALLQFIIENKLKFALVVNNCVKALIFSSVLPQVWCTWVHASLSRKSKWSETWRDSIHSALVLCVNDVNGDFVGLTDIDITLVSVHLLLIEEDIVCLLQRYQFVVLVYH